MFDQIAPIDQLEHPDQEQNCCRNKGQGDPPVSDNGCGWKHHYDYPCGCDPYKTQIPDLPGIKEAGDNRHPSIPELVSYF